MSSEDIAGASPPSVFVGRIGYPNVYAGPLVPPVQEDTSLYDLPELWFGRSMDEIVGFRSMLIRGKHRVHVRRFEEAGKIIDKTRELALAVKPVDVELLLTKKPHGSIFLDDEVQPFGPSAPIRDLLLSNTRWDQHVEKAYSDTDLKAVPAVLELYEQRRFRYEDSKSLQRRRIRPERQQAPRANTLEHNRSGRHRLKEPHGPSQTISRNKRIPRLRISLLGQRLRNSNDSKRLELRSHGSMVPGNRLEPQAAAKPSCFLTGKATMEEQPTQK